jgi:hypothetical protein
MSEPASAVAPADAESSFIRPWNLIIFGTLDLISSNQTLKLIQA